MERAEGCRRETRAACDASRPLVAAMLVAGAVLAGRLAFIATAPRALSGHFRADLASTAVVVGLSLAGSLYYAVRRREVRLALITALPAFFLMGECHALTTQFLIFHTGRDFPLLDARLAAIDAVLGFDWTAYFLFLVGHPVLFWLVSRAYDSIWLQPLALAVGFVVLARARDFCALQIALAISFGLTCAIALVMPALGAYQFHAMTPERHAGIALAFTDGMTAPIMWLRTGDVAGVMPAFPDLRIITFPSWHAAAAVIFAASAWRLPSLRWPALLLNLLMLVATPVQGSHYLSDVIVGAAVGAASLFVAWGSLRVASRHPGMVTRESISYAEGRLT